jgi:hypothetical protein
MIPYSQALQQVVGARTGIAPAHLLDVEDCNGNIYYWANRKMTAPCVIGKAGTVVSYSPWILSVPEWKFYRSMQTDMGTIAMQNISGDTLQRDFEKIVRASALEGAMFVYRQWHADAEYPSREIHGTLSIDDSDPEEVRLRGKQLSNPSADTAPAYVYCEICQWRWSSPQCGATGSVPCQQSFPTCQVPERILVTINSYEKNFGEATANVATKVMNRIRQF